MKDYNTIMDELKGENVKFISFEPFDTLNGGMVKMQFNVGGEIAECIISQVSLLSMIKYHVQFCKVYEPAK